jgi:hypothetical protein
MLADDLAQPRPKVGRPRKLGPTMDTPLTPEELIFIREYVATLDDRCAAKAAGFRPSKGRVLLMDARIAAEVNRQLRPRFAAKKITRAAVMERITEIAMSDPRELYDPVTGQLRNPAQLPLSAAVALKGIKVGQRKTTYATAANGETARIDEAVVEVTRLDPMPALTLLARHFGLVGDGGDRVNGDETDGGPIVALTDDVLDTLSDQQLETLLTAHQTIQQLKAGPPPAETPAPAAQADAGEAID